MVPQKIERYQVIEELGNFGNKTHLKALNQHNNQTVLIELYDASAIGNEERRQIYENRGTVLDSLSSSIILPVIQYGSYGNQAYVVYPFINGKTLREVQTARKKFSPQDVLLIITRLATALDAIHERGTIFGNLRPENIIFNPEGLAHIIGVLLPPRVPDAQRDTDFSYYSPEHINGKEILRQSDNFALAALTFELLTGSTPFRSKTPSEISSALAKDEFPKAKDLVPDLRSDIEEYFESGFKFLPLERPLMASELVDKFKLVNRLTTPVDGKETKSHNNSVSTDTVFNIPSESVFAVDFEEFPSWMFLYETIRMRPLGDDQTGSIYDTQVGLTATQQRLTTSFARTFEINDDEIIEIQPGIATAAEEVDEDYEVNTFFTSARIISILTYVLGALLLSGVGLFVLALFTTDVTASGDSEVAAAPIVAEGEEVVSEEVVSEEIASEEVASEEVDLAEERESEPTIAPTSESEDEAAVGDTEAQAEDGTTTDADDGAASADEDAAAEAEEEVETTPNANETVINIPQVAFPSTVGSPISTELYPPSTEFAVDLRTSQFDESQSGWRLYQSANSVRDVLRYEDIIYAATNGGLTVWDTEEGVAEKITTYDGLGSNDINQLLVCNLPTPTLVIASENGISLFDLERERYRYLNVANRELISDEVVSVSCSESSSFPQLFVGYRSDGVTIHNLNNSSRDKLDRSDGLPTNTVNHLQLVDNQLWISHGIGLTIYDLESNESIIYSENANNIPSQVVNDIVLDQQGLVWMATAGGLMVGNKSGSWTLYTTENTNIPQGVGLSVDVNEDGKIWYGTGFGQICLFDLDSRQCETTYRHPSQDLAFTNQITSIYADETVVIYGHFSDGIKFAPISANQSPSGSDWQTLYLPNQFPNNEVTALAEANEAIWIGTQEGLFQAPIDDLSGENWVFFSRDNVEALENDTIISLTPDENGGIWVGTAKGAVYYNGSSWEDALLTNVQINAVAIDNENSVVWFGTESGIFSYDGRETTAQNNIPADNVVALSLDGDDLYVGTSSGKLGILRGGAYNQFDSNNSPLSPSPIAALAPQPDGSVLLGNGGDLFQLNDGRTLIRVPGPRGFFISNILTTPDQEFIVTTTSNGIFYSERNDWKQLPISEGLPSNRIVDALIDSTGSLWLAGESRNESGGGLARYIPFPETN